MKSIAERLKHARSVKGWSQSHLALVAEVSTGTIGNIESGTRQSKGSLPQIAEALGISHKWLANGEGPAPTAASAAYPAESIAAAHAAKSTVAAYPPPAEGDTASEIAWSLARLHAEFLELKSARAVRRAYVECAAVVNRLQLEDTPGFHAVSTGHRGVPEAESAKPGALADN